MNEKIWLSSPHMGGKEQVYVQQAFDTNWIAPLGPHVDGFEKDLANFTGSKHVAALSSGTSAIHLALILLGVKAGDEVICQSFTFSASANPIAYPGGYTNFYRLRRRHLEYLPRSPSGSYYRQVSQRQKTKSHYPCSFIWYACKNGGYQCYCSRI